MKKVLFLAVAFSMLVGISAFAETNSESRDNEGRYPWWESGNVTETWFLMSGGGASDTLGYKFPRWGVSADTQIKINDRLAFVSGVGGSPQVAGKGNGYHANAGLRFYFKEHFYLQADADMAHQYISQWDNQAPYVGGSFGRKNLGSEIYFSIHQDIRSSNRGLAFSSGIKAFKPLGKSQKFGLVVAVKISVLRFKQQYAGQWEDETGASGSISIGLGIR